MSEEKANSNGSVQKNYYEILQITPTTESENIQRVYRMLAARFHPDNAETGNLELFLELTAAYKVLSDPAAKADYDRTLEDKQTQAIPIFLTREFTDGLEVENKLRIGVLCLLYSKRRSSTSSSDTVASLSILHLEGLMAFPREHLLFAIWYLTKKKFIMMDDRSSYIITADGVDHLEEQLTSNDMYQKIFHASETGVVVTQKALPGR